MVKGSAKVSNAETTIEARENQKIEIKSGVQLNQDIKIVEVNPIDMPNIESIIDSGEFVQTEFPHWDPADGVVKIELNRPDQEVNFNWEGSAEDNSQFELSDEANFDKIIITKKILGSSTKVSFPRTGVFFWRVKQVNDSGNVTFKKPVKVIVRPSPPPKKPVLKKEMRLKIKESSSSVFQSIFDFFFARAWAQDRFVEIPMPTEDAKSFLVEIYSDQEGKNLIKKGVTSKKFFKFENPETGIYWFRVSIIDYWERKGPFSDFSKMIIEREVKKSELLKPKKISLITPIHGHKMVEKKIIFKWNSEVDADFIFEVSDDVRFSDLKIRRVVRGKSIAFEKDELPERFYWRVKQGGKRSFARRVEVFKELKPKQQFVDKQSDMRKSFHKLTRLGLLLRPTMTEYKTTASSNQFNVDGIALNGVGLWFERGQLNEDGLFRPSYSARMNRTAGKVFNTLDFSNIKTSFTYGDFLHYLPFQLNIILELSKRTVFSAVNSSVTEGSEVFYSAVPWSSLSFSPIKCPKYFCCFLHCW